MVQRQVVMNVVFLDGALSVHKMNLLLEMNGRSLAAGVVGIVDNS